MYIQYSILKMGDAIRGLFGSMGKLFGLKDGGIVPSSSPFYDALRKSNLAIAGGGGLGRFVKPAFKKRGGAVKKKRKTKPKKKGKDKK